MAVRMTVVPMAVIVMGIVIMIMAMVPMIIVMVVVMAVPMVMMMIAVIMMVVVVMTAMGIGAALRLEGRAHVEHRGAEPAQHVLDDMVAADEDEILAELRRQVAVAEVPGEAHQVAWVFCQDARERLEGRLDRDAAAVLQFEEVAIAERARLGQVEKEFEPFLALHRHAAAVPRIEIEDDGIGGLARYGFGNADGTDHDRAPRGKPGRERTNIRRAERIGRGMAGNLKQSPGHCHASAGRPATGTARGPV
jgi:hypothetical protein